jgi:hypothetical protein
MLAHEFFCARRRHTSSNKHGPWRFQHEANSTREQARRKLYSNGDSVRKMPCFSEFSPLSAPPPSSASNWSGHQHCGRQILDAGRSSFSRVLMKRELTHCPLRFATAEAYDQPLMRVRKFVVDQSVAEYSLADEPIGAVDGEQAVGERGLSDSAAARPQAVQHPGLEGVCVNPLREEPHPAIIAAVRRFGVVGLVACALGAACARGWRSLKERRLG